MRKRSIAIGCFEVDRFIAEPCLAILGLFGAQLIVFTNAASETLRFVATLGLHE